MIFAAFADMRFKFRLHIRIISTALKAGIRFTFLPRIETLFASSGRHLRALAWHFTLSATNSIRLQSNFCAIMLPKDFFDFSCEDLHAHDIMDWRVNSFHLAFFEIDACTVCRH